MFEHEYYCASANARLTPIPRQSYNYGLIKISVRFYHSHRGLGTLNYGGFTEQIHAFVYECINLLQRHILGWNVSEALIGIRSND